RHTRFSRDWSSDVCSSDLREPISLADIADYAGVSVRSLSRAFQEQYDMSPMQAVRSLRLDKIHGELRSARTGASVTEVALRWGRSEERRVGKEGTARGAAD